MGRSCRDGCRGVGGVGVAVGCRRWCVGGLSLGVGSVSVSVSVSGWVVGRSVGRSVMFGVGRAAARDAAHEAPTRCNERAPASAGALVVCPGEPGRSGVVGGWRVARDLDDVAVARGELSVVGFVAKAAEQRAVGVGLSVAAAQLFLAVGGDDGHGGLDERRRALAGMLDEDSVPVLSSRARCRRRCRAVARRDGWRSLRLPRSACAVPRR